MRDMFDRVTSHRVVGASGAVLGRLGLAVLMTAALLLGGCVGGGAQILLLRSDPALKLEQLEHERVAILPALASSPLLDATELAPMRQQLASHVAQVRPTVHLADAERVDGALGDHPQLAPVLQRFARTLSIDREELGEISEATNARYAVFVVFDEYSFGWGDRPVPVYRNAPEDVTVSSAGPWDDVMEPASLGRLPPPALGFFRGAHGGGFHGGGRGRVSLGIQRVLSSGGTGIPRADAPQYTGNARLAGTVSIFDVAEGRAVWVGAAMVTQSVEPTDGRAAKPPPPAELTPIFFKALVGHWPS
jgi:hypothetical protein